LADDSEPQRSRRDGLLLELGALVYELHRRGRRAPELLQEKAAELDELDADRHMGGKRKADETGSAESGACPACSEPVAADQLVCLNCGERLEPDREERLELDRDERQNSRAGALAALIAVVVIAAGAAGFALSELTSGSDGDDPGGAAQRAADTQAPEPEPEPDPKPPEPEPAPEAEGSPQPAKQSLLLDWPDDLRGHTVVLVNTSDRAAARRVARQAARSGIETGLLRSDDYDLGSGLWIVFAGRFDTRQGAERQAENLGERYPGAYVLLVEPRSQ
jgi:SPOR domain